MHLQRDDTTIRQVRTIRYREIAEDLVRKGAAYRCWCTPERLERIRNEAMAKKQPFQYDQLCLGKTEAERRRLPDCADRPVIRLLMPDGHPNLAPAYRP